MTKLSSPGQGTTPVPSGRAMPGQSSFSHVSHAWATCMPARSYSRVAPVGFSESTPSSARGIPRRWNSVNAAPGGRDPPPVRATPGAHRGCPPRRTRDRERTTVGRPPLRQPPPRRPRRTRGVDRTALPRHRCDGGATARRRGSRDPDGRGRPGQRCVVLGASRSGSNVRIRMSSGSAASAAGPRARSASSSTSGGRRSRGNGRARRRPRCVRTGLPGA